MTDTSILTLRDGQRLLAEIQALRLRLEAIERNLAERMQGPAGAQESTATG